MSLKNLSAGNSKGLDTSVKFICKDDHTNLSVDGLVSGSNSMIQFTFNYDPSEFSCSLNNDGSEVVLKRWGNDDKPVPTVYTVDTGMDLTQAAPDSDVVTFNSVDTVQNTGTLFTFTKSTGGGGRPHKPAGMPV